MKASMLQNKKQTTFNPNRKTTVATIGYNVITCSQRQLALHFATGMKKEKSNLI